MAPNEPQQNNQSLRPETENKKELDPILVAYRHLLSHGRSLLE